MNIIMLGAQGTGKGTVAGLISEQTGLPQISTEELKRRITDDEIESIKRWAKSRKIEYVSIVKKIPFAIFLELG